MPAMIERLVVSFAALIITLIIWSGISINRNISKARAIGLAVLVHYITPPNPLCIGFGTDIDRLARRLGIAFENPFLPLRLGCEWNISSAYSPSVLEVATLNSLLY